MKDLFTFELIILIIIDLIYIYCGITQSNINTRDILFCMSFAHLFLGPLQFIPALFLLRKKTNRDNNHFTLYFILAIATISILTLNISHTEDHEEMITYSLCIQSFAWLLAHYFVYILHTLSRSRERMTNMG